MVIVEAIGTEDLRFSGRIRHTTEGGEELCMSNDGRPKRNDVRNQGPGIKRGNRWVGGAYQKGCLSRR